MDDGPHPDAPGGGSAGKTIENGQHSDVASEGHPGQDRRLLFVACAGV